MVVKAARRSPTEPELKAPDASFSGDIEATVFCPGCTAFETVWFANGHLRETRKYTQVGEYLYHDCGTSKPCRLYRPR